MPPELALLMIVLMKHIEADQAKVIEERVRLRQHRAARPVGGAPCAFGDGCGRVEIRI
jgi:hypothetical protein